MYCYKCSMFSPSSDEDLKSGYQKCFKCGWVNKL